MQLNPTVAENVARAETAFSEATARHDQATTRARNIRARITDLESERTQIIADRTAETDTALPDDAAGARLALINADLEGLRALHSEAERTAEALNPEQAAHTLKMAQDAWERNKLEAEFHELRRKSEETEKVLVLLVAQIADTGRKLGHTHLSMSWKATDSLHRLMHYGALPQ